MGKHTSNFNTSSNTNDITRRFWLCLVTNMFLTYRIWCEWEKHPGIRALVSLSSVKKIWTYDHLQQGKAKWNGTHLYNEKEWEVILCLFRTHGTAISELAKNHEMDRWTSRQNEFFNDEYHINYWTYITLQPGPFVKLIWIHLVIV